MGINFFIHYLVLIVFLVFSPIFVFYFETYSSNHFLFHTDSRHTSDITSVLTVLEKLTGCGHLLPKPSLGHAKYPMKMIDIADEVSPV